MTRVVIFRSPHAISATRHTINYAMLCYSVCSMPALRSQTVYLSTLASCDVACFVTATYALALSCALLCLSITLLLLSHVPCLVSASRCSCSLMCLALSQHHAVALSCALLCLSITLLLSHVPCFVSASRCCSLMCLALSQHHAVALSCALLCLSITLLMCLALSQHATRRSSVLCLVQATRSLSSTRT